MGTGEDKVGILLSSACGRLVALSQQDRDFLVTSICNARLVYSRSGGNFFWLSLKEQRMYSRPRLSLSLLLLISPVALASSPTAWQENQQVMRQACINASTLSKVKIVGQPIDYDDSVGYSALLLEGHYPQKQMKTGVGVNSACFNAAAAVPV